MAQKGDLWQRLGKFLIANNAPSPPPSRDSQKEPFMTLVRVLFCALIVITTTGCFSSPEDSSSSPPLLPSAEISVRILATGASISGANGMQFGPDGLLYVASVIGSELVVLDPDTGEVKHRITEGVNSPDDIAFSSDGSFYWTSILTGEVAGIRPDGSLVTAARLTPGTNPITFSPDDRLFVSQCFFDDKLYEVDPDGIESPRLISDDLGPGCGLNGMDWGPDGRLYGPRWFHGEVVSFDVDALDMRTEAVGIRVPAAVKFDSRGRLHVLDTAAGTILRIDGDEHEVVAMLSPGLDNFAFDATDRLFVSSFVDGFVARVEEDGTNTMLTPSGIAHPGGLTLRDGEHGPEVVIADLQSIRGFGASSGEPTFVHRNVFGVSEMGSVTNISTDGTGDRANLILTSWLDGAVRIWDPVAQKVLETHVELAGPVSALRYNGQIVVAEHGKKRVIALVPDGGGRVEIIASGIPAPTGLAIRDGDLFVTDRERGELLRIASAGSPLNPAKVVASGLSSPEGVAATADGFIVVEGDTGRLVEISMAGHIETLTTLAPGSPAPSSAQPPSMVFNGVAVASNGVVFATGETNRVLYRIDRR
jgi:sugar lactone lactonase YvrE